MGGIIVVYDVTDRQSFYKIQHWLKEIENYGTDSVSKLIVGNKSDLHDKRVVDFASAKEFADELDIPIMEASARSKINVDEIFFCDGEANIGENTSGILWLPSKHRRTAQSAVKA